MNTQLYRYALLLPVFFFTATTPVSAHVLPPPVFNNPSLDNVPLGIAGTEPSRLLKLDNRTYANINDLLDDPFLVLRTQFPVADEEARILAAWEYAAKMHGLEDYPNEIGKNKHPMDSLSPMDNSRDIPAGLVVNHDSVFDHIKPVFSIDIGDTQPENIFWKITLKIDGAPVATVVQGLSTYSHQIELTELQATYLNPNGEYQFQFRICSNDCWSEWSPAFDFSVLKTEEISNIDFNKLSKGRYEISWKGSKDKETRYFIFASNSLDFIPSVYFDKQVKSLANGTASSCVECQNLVTAVRDEKLIIDGFYAYYRIIAEKHGCLSNPSEIIYVYDNELSQTRDVLTFDTDTQSAYRYTMGIRGLLKNGIANAKGWVKSPFISDKDWEKAQPYLMPDNHPMKSRMDRIFKDRVTQDVVAMKTAGFLQPQPRGLHRPVVSKNGLLPGYLVKLFLDTQHGMNDVHRLTRRAIGAESIAKAVQRLGYSDLFRVPKKWIYPLPDTPSPKNGTERKLFVLLVQDMHILTSRSNRRKWKSSEIKRPTLDAIFTLFEDQGLADSLFAFNVPFDQDGFIAVIDTEVHHHWPVPYDKFLKWLSPDNQNYWKSLMKNKPHK